MIRLHWSTDNASAASARAAAELDRTESVLRLVWVVVVGAVLFSLVTSVPLVQKVTPEKWHWTAYFLSVIVDTAVIIVVQVGGAVSSLGESPGGWFTLLRWLTGIYTLFLNIGYSVITKDLTGVAVHAIIPTLLIVCTSAEIRIRERIAKARAIENERAETEHVNAREEERERKEREHRERLEREERAAAARLAEADRLAGIEREKIAAQERQAEADRAAALEKERIAAQERQAEADRREETERQERERAEQAEQERRAHELQLAEKNAAAAIERERLAHEAEQAEARRKHELSLARANARAARSPKDPERSEQRSRDRSGQRSDTPAERSRERSDEGSGDRSRLSQEEAIKIIANTPNASVRTLADITGWSTGWISTHRNSISSTVSGGNSQREEE